MEKNRRYGDSFDRNFCEFTVANRFTNGVLVHALIAAGGRDDVQRAACWIEDRDTVFDFSNSEQSGPLHKHYAGLHIRKLFRYSRKEAIQRSERDQSPGPWDFEDPHRELDRGGRFDPRHLIHLFLAVERTLGLNQSNFARGLEIVIDDSGLGAAMENLAGALGVDRVKFDPERLLQLAREVQLFASNRDRTDEEVQAYIDRWPDNDIEP